MGKYRDHRDQRRRGQDSDRSIPPEMEPSYFQRPSAASGGGRSMDAEVLWFNADKGFGFVKASDGTEAFLHIRVLETAGGTSVSEGTPLKVRIEEGQKGKQVAEVLEIGAAPARAPSHDRPQRSGGSAGGGGAPRRFDRDAPEQETEGTVKWYNSEKGFGFIGLENGEKDIFVHASALTRSGLSTLAEGQRVVVRFVQGQKGPEARSLRPA